MQCLIIRNLHGLVRLKGMLPAPAALPWWMAEAEPGNTIMCCNRSDNTVMKTQIKEVARSG